MVTGGIGIPLLTWENLGIGQGYHTPLCALHGKKFLVYPISKDLPLQYYECPVEHHRITVSDICDALQTLEIGLESGGNIAIFFNSGRLEFESLEWIGCPAGTANVNG